MQGEAAHSNDTAVGGECYAARVLVLPRRSYLQHGGGVVELRFATIRKGQAVYSVVRPGTATASHSFAGHGIT